MPPEFKLNPKRLEDILNWTLPGLQFLYRDTDFPFDAGTLYEKMTLFRAGFFIDCSARAGKLTHNTRFVIASAHSAPVWATMPNDEEMQQWRMHVLHFNSIFKVLDVFHFGGKTQVLLLHIPYSAIPLFSMETTFNFDIEGMANVNLVEMARKSLMDKMNGEVMPELETAQWLERTYRFPGVTDGGVTTLDYVEDSPEVAELSQAVHRLADDDSDINRPEV